jgi:sarcosine oxidase, subunit delta
MLLIPCPWCGSRDEIEFRYGGQAGIAYPADPDGLTDAAWADYLFMRDNPKGPFAERWYHVHGCRRWFGLTRNTATNELLDGAQREDGSEIRQGGLGRDQQRVGRQDGTIRAEG